jgi:hypothetical protein
MASIRRKGPKYHVQIRRKGYRSINHSFHTLKDAQAWARHMEVKADRQDLPPDPNLLKALTLGQFIIRYRDTVSRTGVTSTPLGRGTRAAQPPT